MEITHLRAYGIICSRFAKGEQTTSIKVLKEYLTSSTRSAQRVADRLVFYGVVEELDKEDPIVYVPRLMEVK